MINTKKYVCISFILSLILILSACGTSTEPIDLASLEYQQEIYVEVNNNAPQFQTDEITKESFEVYSELDELGRCGVAFACIGKDIMPTEERGPIGQIKPSGWQLAKYDIVDGKYLYNRCHLIGYQLTGENANEKNLITGTRSMNVDGMLPFENKVDDYIEETNNHVMYRVTPIYEGENLVARGVQIEAYSVEDDGEGISFNVFVFNAQPGIKINYADGTSELIDNSIEVKDKEAKETDISKQEEDNKDTGNNEVQTGEYVLNTNTMKIHYKDCPSVEDIQPNNRESFNGAKDYLLDNGYTACGRCKP